MSEKVTELIEDIIAKQCPNLPIRRDTEGLDLNTLVSPGIYQVDDSTANRPGQIYNYGIAVVMRVKQFMVQIYIPNVVNPGQKALCYRSSYRSGGEFTEITSGWKYIAPAV